MRGRVTRILLAVSLAAIWFVAGGDAHAQTPGAEPPTHGDLLPGGAGVGAGYHEFGPGGGGEAPPAGSNTNRECWLELDGRSISLEELQATYSGSGSTQPIRVTRICQDIGGGNVSPAVTFEWPTEAPDVMLTPEELRDMAYERLWFPPPNGDMSPGIATGTFAQLPTWYWVGNIEPGPEARATAGPVWARVWAEAVRQDWTIESPQYGNVSFSCEGPGVPYNPSTDGDTPPDGACPPWQPPHSSAGEESTHEETGQACFPAVVTVTWNVMWESSATAPAGLGTGESAASTCIVVQEIQAVVTDG